MKNIIHYLTLGILFLASHVNAQDCELPEPYPGIITGANMTIMLSPAFMQSLPNIDENAYLVAISQTGFVCGSVSVLALVKLQLLYGEMTPVHLI